MHRAHDLTRHAARIGCDQFDDARNRNEPEHGFEAEPFLRQKMCERSSQSAIAPRISSRRSIRGPD